MDNQIPSAENMSVSAISALSNVKEVHGESTNYIHIVLLLLMIAFAGGVVALSVYNFQANVTPEVKVIHAEGNHSQDVEKLTNQ